MPTNRHEQFLRALPSDWEKVPINQLGAIHSGGTPSRDVPSFWNGAIPWVTPGEFASLTDKWLTETRECITEAGLANSAAKLLPRGSLLVTTRATVGAVALAAMPVCTNQGFKSVVPDQLADSEFYYYLFQLLTPEFTRLASGSTFVEISRQDFSGIVVPRPPLPEQRRIAEILDSIDAAIQQTEALIAKLKMMKAGLLHDLLTRGLDEHGQLRDPGAHPGEFKDSPLGKIPRQWALGTIRSVSRLVTKGTTPTTYGHHYAADGVLFLRVENLTEDGAVGSGEVVFISRAAHRFLRRSQLEAGDVLISIAGTIGRVGLIPASSLPANINQALALVRVDISCMEPEFLRFFLTSEAGKRVLFSQTVQLAQANLSLGQIANAQIPVPSPTEQRRIVSVLFAHESRIRAEEDYCDKLKQLKKGLMHDLVTGRVRVNIRDEVQP